MFSEGSKMKLPEKKLVLDNGSSFMRLTARQNHVSDGKGGYKAEDEYYVTIKTNCPAEREEGVYTPPSETHMLLQPEMVRQLAEFFRTPGAEVKELQDEIAKLRLQLKTALDDATAAWEACEQRKKQALYYHSVAKVLNKEELIHGIPDELPEVIKETT
jgi:hypothetical protein